MANGALCLTVSSLPFSYFIAVHNETGQLSPLHYSTWSKKGISRLPSFKVASKLNDSQVKHRRSAHYHPTIWDSNLIESFTIPHNYKCHSKQIEDLKGKARGMLKSSTSPEFLLQTIDTMQRLGVAYHFESEIHEVLSHLRSHASCDLYIAALQFRLLRDNGFSAGSDVFDKFRSKNGRFLSSLSQDTDALLSLFEATHLEMPGEEILEEAKSFSSKHLRSLQGKLEASLVDRVQHCLEIPLHRRLPRLDARNFIDDYQKNDSKNLILLDLAKFDYNLVQSIYKQELQELSRWWTKLDFKSRLTFSRDRLVENYLWAMGIISEPQFSKCRIGLTKFVCILTAIDDIYDVYALPHERESFTVAVNRWDMKAVEDLPEYLKICYVALHDFVNELAHDILEEQGFDISPYIKEQWGRLCRSYLVEAQWFSRNYVPSMEEYLKNAWISVGGPAMIVHGYPLLGCTVTDETVRGLENSKLTYWSSLITRLWDDLGTSKDERKRGDVAKSIDCYMEEKGATWEEAEDYVRGLIEYSWKKMNEEIVKSELPKPTVKMLQNMARTAQCIFQHGDGIGTSTGKTRDNLKSLIVDPVPI